MKDNQFSVHKSMVLSNRKALALYLFKINRSHDIPEIMLQALDLDKFDGDRVPLEVVTKEINLAAHTLQEDYLGLKVMDLADIKFLPLYQGIKLCINPLLNTDIQIPFIVLCRLVARYFKVITESIQVCLIEETNLLRLDFKPSMPEQFGVCQHSCHPYLNQATKTSVALTRLDGRTGFNAVGETGEQFLTFLPFQRAGFTCFAITSTDSRLARISPSLSV